MAEMIDLDNLSRIRSRRSLVKNIVNNLREEKERKEVIRFVADFQRVFLNRRVKEDAPD